MEYKITVNSNVEKRFQSMVAALGKELEQAMEAVGNALVNETQSNLDNKLLHKHSGNLFNSVRMAVVETSYGYLLTVGSDLPYAAVQDQGGSAGKNGATRIPASGYMTKAAQLVQRHMKVILESHINKAIE